MGRAEFEVSTATILPLAALAATSKHEQAALEHRHEANGHVRAAGNEVSCGLPKYAVPLTQS